MASTKRKVEDTDLPVDGGKPSKIQKVDESKDDTASPKSTKASKTKTKSESKSKSGNADSKNVQSGGVIQRIQKQLEFYFSDGNLPTDTHLNEVMGKNNGFYPIRQLLIFNKIKALTQSVLDLQRAIERSSQIEMNAERSGVKRHSSLPPLPTAEDLNKRTIFAKGFHPRTTQQQLTQFWKSQVPNESDVKSVFMIKDRITTGLIGKNERKEVFRFTVCACFKYFPSEFLREIQWEFSFNELDPRTFIESFTLHF